METEVAENASKPEPGLLEERRAARADASKAQKQTAPNAS